ncbi:MAG: hypothetical protein HRT45_07960 [Bdellovibrionales bacterium]|nr:hypothetical protein [Bdellovibrionales bacterium]
MIEYRISREGQRYFVWNGRHICSSRDPIKEAQAWVDGFDYNFDSVSQAVVLGLGAGFHVVELQNRFPHLTVHVIECQSEFICPALNLHDQAFRAEVLLTETVSIFKAQSRLKSILSAPYLVLRYAPVCNLNRETFGEIGNLLTGRTIEALKFQVQKRQGLLGKFQFESLVGDANGSLLSIKDLDRAMSPQSNHQEFHLVRALRELVV